MAKRATTHVERFRQLCREIARQLNAKQNDPRVEHVATLKLMREGLQANLLAGQHIETADLLRLDEALKPYMAVAEEPLKVKLTIVENVHGIYRCKHCGEQNILEPFTYEPIPERNDNRRYPRTIDAAVAESSSRDENSKGDTCRALPPPKPVEAKPKPLRDKDGYVPRQPHTGAPLKSTPSYSDVDPLGGVVNGSNPLSVRNSSRLQHPLRDPNDAGWDVVT